MLLWLSKQAMLNIVNKSFLFSTIYDFSILLKNEKSYEAKKFIFLNNVRCITYLC